LSGGITCSLEQRGRRDVWEGRADIALGSRQRKTDGKKGKSTRISNARDSSENNQGGRRELDDEDGIARDEDRGIRNLFWAHEF
jgi:hypothetical protein